MSKVKDPVFIIGCPRSGTTLLYSILHGSDELWSSSNESHYVWEKFLPDPRDPMFSMYLTEKDFSEGDREYVENKYNLYTYKTVAFGTFTRNLFFNRSFGKFFKPFLPLWSGLNKFIKGLFTKEYRVLDKTPPNTYRVSYLKKVFPEAKFIYIKRDGKTNISSLINGWRSGKGKDKRFSFKFRRFYDYNDKMNIKGYDGDVWKFTNPPGWEDYMNKPLEDVCAFQWHSAHKYALESFAQMEEGKDYVEVKYEELVANPPKHIEEICEFIDIPYDGWVKENAEELPVVSTSSKPYPNKWLKNKEMIENIEPVIEEMQRKLGYDLEDKVAS